MQLIFATHNKNKLNEVNALISKAISLLSLDDIHLPNEIEETELTIEGNALLKAKTIYNQTHINCFADDSGLCIDILKGAPGVYSARYAGEPKSDEANINKVLHKLSGEKNRAAHFKTVMALVMDGKEFLFEGIVNGKITEQKIGANGFGYDPIFIPNGYENTFAEMSKGEKNAISHRGIALHKMIEFLKTI